MLALEDYDSLLFWDPFDIASLAPESHGRWRAVNRDGRVAHRPTPPPDGPWLPLGSARVLPQHLVRTANGWKDPAGFMHPAGRLKPVRPPATLPPIQGLACQRRQIYALLRKGDGCVWKTDVGDFDWKRLSPPQAWPFMPELVRVRPGIYVNPQRVERIRHGYVKFLVTLDNGVIYSLRKDEGQDLAGRFGLPNLLHLEPYNSCFYGNYRLRDWPFELARCGPEILRGLFSCARELIANLIYQRLRYRQQGDAREWPESYRQFWYRSVKHCLYHAGFLEEADLGWEAPESPRGRRSKTVAQKMYYLMFEVFEFFLNAELFCFEEFGFSEARPEFRRIGAGRPEIILVTEKGEFQDWALRLHQEFGVSLRMLSSQPSLLGSEFFAKALKPVVIGPVRIIAYVDYDVGGWIIARALAKQLRKYGLEVERVDFMITADAFTPEEKRLHAHPLAMTTGSHRTKAVDWFAETNGVDGQMLGMQADHIKSFERIRELFMAKL